MSGFDDQERLSAELHRQARDLDGHPIGLDAVKSRARRIRRRRAAGGAVAAAAVLAVVVPTAVALTGQTTGGNAPVAQGTPAATASTATGAATGSPGPSASASPSPTQTETPVPPSSSATPEGVGGPLTLAGIPAGAPPKISYLDGSTVHTDGAATSLPGTYSAVVGYHGGWLALGRDANGPTAVRIDPTGKVTGTAPGAPGLAVNGDGTEVAWIEHGTLTRGIGSGMGNGEDTQKLPAGQSGSVVGFAGGDLVYSLGSGTVHATDLNGHDRTLPGLIAARGTNDIADLVAGETRSNSDGTSCWVLRDLNAGTDRFAEECDWALQAVSPDAKYVVGIPSNSDGAGSSRVALLDARTGAVVSQFAGQGRPPLFVTELGWEDETHVLAVAFEHGTWQILRLGVDGSVESTVTGRQGTDTDSPYHLNPRP